MVNAGNASQDLTWLTVTAPWTAQPVPINLHLAVRVVLLNAVPAAIWTTAHPAHQEDTYISVQHC